MKDDVYLICAAPNPDYDFLSSLHLEKKRVIAVDGGVNICDKLNIIPHKIIGDLDSADTQLLSKYDKKSIFLYPIEKDKSDTELSIDYAIESGYERIFLLNAIGGRLDHTLFNQLLLFKDEGRIYIDTKDELIFALKQGKQNEIKLEKDELFSLIPFSKLEHLTLTGAKFEIYDSTLVPNSKGLSNIAFGTVNITFKKGKVLLYLSKQYKQI